VDRAASSPERGGLEAVDEQCMRSIPCVVERVLVLCGSASDGGPAGFVRLGLVPNQRRAMLWCYVHRDGEWLGIDESRLRYEDFDLADGSGTTGGAPVLMAPGTLRLSGSRGPAP
jgi:hypothetical protein